MTGGFVGEMKTASQADIADAQAKLKVSLGEKARKNAVAQTPADYILYYDPSFVVFKDVSSNIIGAATTTTEGDQTFEVTGAATVYGILFSTKELAAAVAGKLVSDYKGEDVIIQDIDSIKFTMTKPEGFDITNLQQFDFHLKGQANVEWLFDVAALKAKLAGMKKSDYGKVFGEFPGILKANVEMSPVWAVTFPKDVKKISIIKLKAS
jgi:hypothetical protein